MSLPAFYLAPENWSASPVLAGEEAKHAQVLRLRPGDQALILDGLGKTGLCRVEGVEKKRVNLRLEKDWDAPEPQAKAIIAIALSKAVRRGFFLEKTAELGAWAIWLWQAVRSQGKLEPRLAETAARQLAAGAKQCHNPWFPQIDVFKNAVQLASASQKAQWKLMPWEEKAGQCVIPQNELARPGATIFVIGPEGGLTEQEAEIFIDAGFVPASLGSRVLRCETAATFCLSLHWWAAQKQCEMPENLP